MCQASAMFDSLPKVRVNEDVTVAEHGGSKLFARPTKGRSKQLEFCCIPSGSTILFAELSATLQQRLGITGPVAAKMISPDADRIHTHTDRDDEFEIVATGQRFFLHQLPIGTLMRRVRPAVQTQAVRTPPAEQPIQMESVDEHELVGASA